MTLSEHDMMIMKASKSGDIVPLGDGLLRVTAIDHVTDRISGVILDCEWFLRCDRPATYLTPHPILGYVPTCAWHNTFAGYYLSDR